MVEKDASKLELGSEVMQVAQKLDGAASILALLEDKADSDGVTASELSSVRCVIECCSKKLDDLFIDY